MRVFFPTPLVFLGRGVLSSSSRMTNSGVWSRLRFLAFGSSALSERGSSSDGSVGGCFPQTFSWCFEPELEALLEGCETRLAGAHFRRLAIESSWSPKESTGPVDFWCFSSSLHASASSFPLASSPQNNPAACLADWCDFFLESGVVFAALERGWLDFVGVLDEPGMFWQVGMAVTHSTKDAGQLAKQLGGPRRDSPSNNPRLEPHRLGTIWVGMKTWFVAMLFISCQKEQVSCRMVLKRAPTCSWGTCSLARSTSWVWMFHRASLVCCLATAKAGARRWVARGKTGVSWGSCSLGMNSRMESRASFPACRASASSWAWSLVLSSVEAIAGLTESSQ